MLARRIRCDGPPVPPPQFYATSLPCDLSVSGQPFGPNTLSFALQKDSPLTAPLNAAILEVRPAPPPSGPCPPCALISQLPAP